MPVRDKLLRERYRDSVNGCCELDRLRYCCGGRVGEVHHILAGPHRHDVWSNLLCVCRDSHNWIHDVNPVEGRMCCWYAKFLKGEFDVAEIQRVWGQSPIAWLERKLCEVQDMDVDRWARELIAECA